ncbi:helix-turn-helix domain-containing protein [Saccharibacillus sp. CPCC 101409]|uniref:TetR/AcrR family transcriptional regulator n=1 Tax=Saccharibacillus sp. CPCC 101409 TaxID=3058041 RepID=UPI0026731811|nr:TetR/AcrR family transcriptional regulator [Saccharibacillus sp. CPCC 101409]MDO3411511.1 helix-turn-helix domain-containing protein [Saccharibacillus sp. CPCC 101409]
MAQERASKRMTSRDLQAAERKQQILNSAKRLFAEKGYHATSMRELNKAIGMAEALTYHYFPGGKYEILTTVLQNAQDERIGGIVGFFEAAFRDPERPLRDVLAELIAGLAQRLAEDRAYFQILIRERGLLEQEQKDSLDSVTRLPFEAMSAYLAQSAARGRLRQMDYPLAASQFLAHVVFDIIQNMLKERTADPAEADKLADFYVQLWER